MDRWTDNPAGTVSGQSDGVADGCFLPTIPLPKRIPEKAMAIADVANLFGVTHRTLHFYEEKKLLQPSRIGSMRVYAPHQVKTMALINLCRETGMPVAQIQELLLELGEAPTQAECELIFRAAMTARKNELIADESLIRRQMQQINEILTHQDDETGFEGNGNRRKNAPFLSDFEFQCLKLMAEGYSPIRISNALQREIDDIMATETGIIRKFGSSNRFQAVAKAVLLGLIGD